MRSVGARARAVCGCAVLLLAAALCACAAPRGGTDYLRGHPALAGDGLIHVVVEIPAGTSEKWEVDKTSGALELEQRDGGPRVIRYLAYPGSYGMVPRTRLPRELGGDGDPLDVLLLGPAVARGSVVRARPVGVLRLLDDGERDDKILAVRTRGPLSDVTDLTTLDARYPGVRQIVETWFTHYKGPGRIRSGGFADAVEAMAIVEEASRYHDRGADGD